MSKGVILVSCGASLEPDRVTLVANRANLVLHSAREATLAPEGAILVSDKATFMHDGAILIPCRKTLQPDGVSLVPVRAL
jgi:hypothetical protein